MGSVLITLFISFSITFLMIPVIIKLAWTKRMLDLPGSRKIHQDPIPSMGGIAIFLAVIVAILLSVDLKASPQIPVFLLAFSIIFYVGIKDDMLFFSPGKKFAGQLIAVLMLVYQGYYQLKSFDGFLGIGLLSPFASFVFTAFTMLVIINAFNLIDGVDGLAATLGLCSTLFLGIVFWLLGDATHALIALVSAASLFAFLLFNWSPAKIFLGDTGSLLVGLVNAVLVVRLISSQTETVEVRFFAAAPSIGIALLFIPMADMLRLVIVRLFQGKSPFEPDMQHLHHHLLGKGLSHRQVTWTITALNTFFVVYAVVFQHFGNTFLIVSMFVIGFCLLQVLKSISFRAKTIRMQIPDDIGEIQTYTRLIHPEKLEKINSSN